jgi:hypothetical protein
MAVRTNLFGGYHLEHQLSQRRPLLLGIPRLARVACTCTMQGVSETVSGACFPLRGSSTCARVRYGHRPKLDLLADGLRGGQRRLGHTCATRD